MCELLRRSFLDAGGCSPKSCLSATVPREDQDPGRGLWLLSAPPTTRSALSSRTSPPRGAGLYYYGRTRCGLRGAFHGWNSTSDGKWRRTADLCRIHYKTRSAPRLPDARMGANMYLGLYGPRPSDPDCRISRCPCGAGRAALTSNTWQTCNWVQAFGAASDTAHFLFLHAVLTKDEKVALAIVQPLGGVWRHRARPSRARDPQRSPPKFSSCATGRPGDRAARRKTTGRSLLAHRPFLNPPRLRAGGDCRQVY